VEATEDWIVDRNPELADRLVRFGHKLSQPDAAKRLAEADRNELLFFLVYISSSKAFRLIQWMDETENGLGSSLLGVLLQSDGAGVYENVADPLLAGVMIQRLRTIQNTPFFARLLSPAVLGDIELAIKQHQEEKSQ